MNFEEIFKQDQNDEGTRRLCHSFSVYYQTLAKELPEDLAADLTSDYHWLLMCSIMYKDGNFPPRS